MYRRQRKRIPEIMGIIVIVLLAAVWTAYKRPAIQKTTCVIKNYKNLEVPISKRTVSLTENTEDMAENLLECAGNPQKTEDFLRCTGGKCKNREEFQKMIFMSLAEEENYIREIEMRQGVLREILKISQFSEDVEDKETMILLAVYEKENLCLTEKEIEEGIRSLQEVFGVSSGKELECFLDKEEQLRIIKKEKTYEYLLENNEFVPVSESAFHSKGDSGGRIPFFFRLSGRMDR